MIEIKTPQWNVQITDKTTKATKQEDFDMLDIIVTRFIERDIINFLEDSTTNDNDVVLIMKDFSENTEKDNNLFIRLVENGCVDSALEDEYIEAYTELYELALLRHLENLIDRNYELINYILRSQE